MTELTDLYIKKN